jgi:sugar/nucleoside kinase (ribokinase family)
MFDVVTVGHLSIDSIFLPGRHAAAIVLGGSVAYASLAARRLEARVGVISKVGGDFPEAYRWWFEQEHIGLSGVMKIEEAETTRFELKYSDDLSSRVLFLRNRAPPITVDDLPVSLEASAIHLAPIDGEIGYDVAEAAKKSTEVLSLDPQGLVRDFAPDGSVNSCSLADKRILGLVDIYKSSSDEIKSVTDLSDLDEAIRGVHDCGVKIVIVTLGSAGVLVSGENDSHRVPACTPTKLVDPTGAGDVFMGGFLEEYVNGSSILRCACVGSAAASFAVEGVGPTALAEKVQVYERARALYEKEIKE